MTGSVESKQLQELAQGLHPLERKILPAISKSITMEELMTKTGLKDIEVMRALQWLSNKKIIVLEEVEVEKVTLDANGIKYLKDGLPESRFLNAIRSQPKKMSELPLEKEEIGVCIGMLKKKGAIDVSKDMVFSITDIGKSIADKDSLEEKFLKKSFPLELTKLNDEERFALEELKRRKQIVQVTKTKARTAKITSLGAQLQAVKTVDIADKLTPEMLKSGQWKGKTFRRYDIQINVPKITGGRRHYESDVIDHIRKIWIELGFEEMSGTMIQTSFWNFDALFTAQDHPVREMQDTFFIKNPKNGSLPKKELVDKICATHENGGNTGSRGWRYSWNPEEAKKNVLRTHTTCLSANTIAKLKETDLPKKYFSIGKCFRNESLDYSHLFEFNQIEGIVVDENVTFRHLIGYLQEFFHKMGYTKVRIRPAYFPYTEPSAEVDVYDETKGQWLELAGAGMFRPEMTKPLFGKDVPVLAWGMGLGRIIKMYYNLDDIRELNRNDLKQIREMKTWMR